MKIVIPIPIDFNINNITIGYVIILIFYLIQTMLVKRLNSLKT